MKSQDLEPAAQIQLGRTRFETEMQVRPDDIDMNQHVHGSRYFDYVLAARYDQMERCYKMPMQEFPQSRLRLVYQNRPRRIQTRARIRRTVSRCNMDRLRFAATRSSEI